VDPLRAWEALKTPAVQGVSTELWGNQLDSMMVHNFTNERNTKHKEKSQAADEAEKKAEIKRRDWHERMNERAKKYPMQFRV